MSKYIDTEKLIAKIRQLRSNYEIAKSEILDIIDSLQQDQPEQTCKTCGFYENNCPFIRGKLIPYPNKVCKDYTYSVMKEQEQLEVDITKEIEEHAEDMPHCEFSHYSEVVNDEEWAKKEFRYFYELGRVINARKEE